MSEIEFEELWKDLIHVQYKDGGYENTRQVLRYLGGLSDDKRSVFLDELVVIGVNKSDGWGIALAVLESQASTRQIQTLCERVSLLFSGEPESESNLVWVLRVLASDATAQCLAPVEEYLLARKIGSYWTSLPWALWPHHADLFCRAWVRYFTSRSSKEWRHSVIPQAFLSRADALAALRQQLVTASAGTWNELRSVLEEQRCAPWLNDEQRKSLGDVLV